MKQVHGVYVPHIPAEGLQAPLRLSAAEAMSACRSDKRPPLFK